MYTLTYSNDSRASVILQEVGTACSDTVSPLGKNASHGKSAVGPLNDAANTRRVGSEKDLGREEMVLSAPRSRPCLSFLLG